MAKRKTQRERILEYMKRFGEITQLEAVNLGCLRLAAQIHDMKKQGIEIWAEYREVKNRDGSTSRIAAYSLIHPEAIKACSRCGCLTDSLTAYEEEDGICKHCARMLEIGDEMKLEDDE